MANIGYQLLVQTQVRENKGLLNYRGVGPIPQDWMLKGQKTYVMDLRTPDKATDVLERYKHMMTSCSSFREEFIVRSFIVDEASFDFHVGDNYEMLTDEEEFWVRIKVQVNPFPFHPMLEIDKAYCCIQEYKNTKKIVTTVQYMDKQNEPLVLAEVLERQLALEAAHGF